MHSTWGRNPTPFTERRKEKERGGLEERNQGKSVISMEASAEKGGKKN